MEEEFLVIHPDRAAPRPVGDAVAARAGAGSDGQFEHELMREQAELATEPHAAAADLHDDLRRRRGELARAAAESGTRLAALATSPRPAQPHLTPDSRYVRMLGTFGGIAAAQLTCGMHVHVSVDTPEDGVLALDGLRPWLPVLLALTGNSPYWRGEDTAYESFRTVLWGQWPTAGRVPAVASPDEYERLVSDLVTSGAASDDGMIYFDARLSRRYPTVEVRVCDVTPYADDAVTVAVLLRALVTAAPSRSGSTCGAPGSSRSCSPPRPGAPPAGAWPESCSTCGTGRGSCRRGTSSRTSSPPSPGPSRRPVTASSSTRAWSGSADAAPARTSSAGRSPRRGPSRASSTACARRRLRREAARLPLVGEEDEQVGAQGGRVGLRRGLRDVDLDELAAHRATPVGHRGGEPTPGPCETVVAADVRQGEGRTGRQRRRLHPCAVLHRSGDREADLDVEDAGRVAAVDGEGRPARRDAAGAQEREAGVEGLADARHRHARPADDGRRDRRQDDPLQLRPRAARGRQDRLADGGDGAPVGVDASLGVEEQVGDVEGAGQPSDVLEGGPGAGQLGDGHLDGLAHGESLVVEDEEEEGVGGRRLHGGEGGCRGAAGLDAAAHLDATGVGLAVADDDVAGCRGGRGELSAERLGDEQLRVVGDGEAARGHHPALDELGEDAGVEGQQVGGGAQAEIDVVGRHAGDGSQRGRGPPTRAAPGQPTPSRKATSRVVRRVVASGSNWGSELSSKRWRSPG
ncbi:hypothetical protein BN12_2190004 [Nostocoides japonicum T1-X7]|uniref:Putative glutamate--cysteine ligase 2 n=1 Tax=Nostocoides japonicum T1-X7 TaxID=1194083 RepID=A0A077M0K5_9MICO|nr:hypothetical protein BN12_2190004 [Tetrasphaera japonica T1-X7]